MKANQAEYPIRLLCEVLDVSPSGSYAWVRRPLSPRARANAVVLEEIERIHRESGEAYGVPNIQMELQEAGHQVNHTRLMRGAGLQGIMRRKYQVTTRRDPAAVGAADLVDREFLATAPNQLWVADITYIPTWAGFLYLAIVLDVFSRRIAGWAMQATLETSLVLDALNMAIGPRQPTAVIHHSDHGCQYTSVQFGKRCRGGRRAALDGLRGRLLQQRDGRKLLRDSRVRTAGAAAVQVPC